MNHTYIIIERDTRKVLTELFQASTVAHVNRKKYIVRTARAHLSTMNRSK